MKSRFAPRFTVPTLTGLSCIFLANIDQLGLLVIHLRASETQKLMNQLSPLSRTAEVKFALVSGMDHSSGIASICLRPSLSYLGLGCFARIGRMRRKNILK